MPQYQVSRSHTMAPTSPHRTTYTNAWAEAGGLIFSGYSSKSGSSASCRSTSGSWASCSNERSTRAGGRVGSEWRDGYCLDRSLQVVTTGDRHLE